MKYKVADKIRIRNWRAMKRVGITASPDIIKLSGAVGFIRIINGADGLYSCDFESQVVYVSIQEIDIEGYAFEYGDEIEVSSNEKDWNRRIYVGYQDGTALPYSCIPVEHEDLFTTGEKFFTSRWRHARPIQKKHTIIIDGVVILNGLIRLRCCYLRMSGARLW